MIKKIIILLSVAFAVIIGAGKASANTTTVKVEVISRNIKAHTIHVKTDDHNANKFTLKEVSTAQMDVANKGSIIKVTYDDDFNVSAVEKVKNKAISKPKTAIEKLVDVLQLIEAVGVIIICGLCTYMLYKLYN